MRASQRPTLAWMSWPQACISQCGIEAWGKRCTPPPEGHPCQPAGPQGAPGPGPRQATSPLVRQSPLTDGQAQSPHLADHQGGRLLFDAAQVRMGMQAIQTRVKWYENKTEYLKLLGPNKLEPFEYFRYYSRLNSLKPIPQGQPDNSLG